MNKRGVSRIDDFLLTAFYLSIIFLTFFSNISFNIYLIIFLLGLIFIKAITSQLKINNTYFEGENIVFYILSFLLFMLQYIFYGFILNIGLFALIALLLMMDFLHSLNLKKNYVDVHRLAIAFLILFLSIFTIRFDSSNTYVFSTGAGGILSAYVLLAGLVIAFASRSNILIFLSFIFLLLLLVGSVRGTVYAALGFMTLYYIGKQRRLILPIIIILMFVLLVFLINPNSRLFETHTSGRIIHWLLIINSFELDRILFGMGYNSSSNILIMHGLESYMASAHNEFLRVFYDFGLMGLSCLLIIIYKFLKIFTSNKLAYSNVLFLPFFFDIAISYMFSLYFFYISFCKI